MYACTCTHVPRGILVAQSWSLKRRKNPKINTSNPNPLPPDPLLADTEIPKSKGTLKPLSSLTTGPLASSHVSSAYPSNLTSSPHIPWSCVQVVSQSLAFSSTIVGLLQKALETIAEGGIFISSASSNDKSYIMGTRKMNIKTNKTHWHPSPLQTLPRGSRVDTSVSLVVVLMRKRGQQCWLWVQVVDFIVGILLHLFPFFLPFVFNVGSGIPAFFCYKRYSLPIPLHFFVFLENTHPHTLIDNLLNDSVTYVFR